MARIGIVSPEFPPEKGGIQTYGYEYALELSRRGHDVTVFTCPHAQGELSDTPFRIEPVLKARRRHDRAILRDKSFDVWHTMNAVYAWMAEESPRVFVTVHGNDFLCPYLSLERLDLRERYGLPWPSKFDRWLGDKLTAAMVQRSLPKAAHVFTNSHFTERTFLRHNPGCQGKTSAAMVGVASRYFSHPRPERSPGPPRITTVCRLAEPHKNVDLVLRALARLRERFDFAYTIVGDGYLRPGLEELTRELGLSDRVTFTGFVEPDTLQQLLLNHDLFVLTTSETPVAYEGFGLVYLEAGACGCPALAARIAGAAEAIDEGKSGMFVDEVNVDRLEAQLARFLSGSIQFSSDNCVAFARKFTWPAVVDHCLQHYPQA